MRRDMTHNPFDHPSLYTRYIASSVRANPTNTRLVIACYLVTEKDSDFSLPAIFCVSNQTCSAISRERNVGTLTKCKDLLFSKRKSTDFAIDNKIYNEKRVAFIFEYEEVKIVDDNSFKEMRKQWTNVNTREFIEICHIVGR